LDVNDQFKNIRVKKLRPSKVVELLKNNKDIFVIDVRPENFKKGPNFIEGSVHCPLLHIIERLDLIPKDKPLIVVDWKMMQSPLAAKYLQGQGYSILGVVRGGIERWVFDGFPTEVRQVTIPIL
jgi:rhodanese-related sulfurtransferase